MTEKDFLLPDIPLPLKDNGSFTWRSPSNIALVKYWGKYGQQLPMNPSLSFTLNTCHTLTTLTFKKRKTGSDDSLAVEVIFSGKKEPSFKPKILTFFERIQPYVPFVSNYDYIIESKNSFPHSSGIASSASGMSALALCIMSIERNLRPEISKDYFYRKASFLARLGSGSASRSIFGNLVMWGAHKAFEGSSDLYGIAYPYKVHPNFLNYQDTILLVDKGEKTVSSTIGHGLMEGHPFAQQRFEEAKTNMLKLKKILENGNLKKFINLVETEALSLHAMMLTSTPGFVLMKPNTLEIIERIRKYRARTGNHICFTLDAGANVHVLFPDAEKKQINAFISDELIQYCQENHYICDMVGNGAKEIA